MGNNAFYSLCLIVFAVSFISIPVVLIKTIPELKKQSLPALVALLLIITAAAGYRFVLIPHKSKVFYLEYEIINAARMISREKEFSFCESGSALQCEKKSEAISPSGFPFLLSQAFKASGSEEAETAFNFSALLGVLSVILVFLIAFNATGRMNDALFSTFFITVFPLHNILSTNATAEGADFFMLCLAAALLVLYLRSASRLIFACLIFSAIGAVLVKPDNFFLLAFMMLLIYIKKPHGKSELLYVFIFAVVIMVIFNLLPSIYKPVFNTGFMNSLRAFKTNAFFLFFRNIYVPKLFLAAAVLGVFSIRKSGFGAWLVVLLVLNLCINSIMDIRTWEGDMVRYALPAALPIVFFAGIGVSALMDRIKQKSIKNGFAVTVLFLSMILYYNTNFFRFHDMLESQDLFLSENLPSIPAECSVFSMNTSIAMFYTKNKSYLMSDLKDKNFLSKHPECKILIKEQFCAVDLKKECDEDTVNLKTSTLRKKYIADMYMVEIDSVQPATQTVEIKTDAKL